MQTNDQELEGNLRKLPITKLKKRCKAMKLSAEGTKVDLIKRIMAAIAIPTTYSYDNIKNTKYSSTKSTINNKSKYKYLPSLSTGIYGSYPSVIYKEKYERVEVNKPQDQQWIYHPTAGYICVSFDNNIVKPVNSSDEKLLTDNINKLINVDLIKQLLQRETNATNAIDTLSSKLPFKKQTNNSVSNSIVSYLVETGNISFSQK
eukprot:453948_1